MEENQSGLGRSGGRDTVWMAGRKTAEIQAGLDSSPCSTTVFLGDFGQITEIPRILTLTNKAQKGA